MPDLSPAVRAMRCTELAFLVLHGVKSIPALAQALGVSNRTVTYALNSDQFRAEFERLRLHHADAVLEVARDEELTPLARAVAIQAKAQTVLTDVLEHVRARIRDAQDPSTIAPAVLQAAVKAADTGMSYGTLNPRGGPTTAVQVNVFQPNAEQAVAIREAAQEAEIDITDLLKAGTDDGRDSGEAA